MSDSSVDLVMLVVSCYGLFGSFVERDEVSWGIVKTCSEATVFVYTTKGRNVVIWEAFAVGLEC